MSRSRRKVSYEQDAPKWHRRMHHKAQRAFERSHGVEAHPKQFGRMYDQDDMDFRGTEWEERGKRK